MIINSLSLLLITISDQTDQKAHGTVQLLYIDSRLDVFRVCWWSSYSYTESIPILWSPLVIRTSKAGKTFDAERSIFYTHSDQSYRKFLIGLKDLNRRLHLNSIARHLLNFFPLNFFRCSWFKPKIVPMIFLFRYTLHLCPDEIYQKGTRTHLHDSKPHLELCFSFERTLSCTIEIRVKKREWKALFFDGKQHVHSYNTKSLPLKW